jgi:hypothetical protein
MSRYLVVKRFGVSKNLCVPKSCLISTQKKQKGHNKEDQKRERPESSLIKKHKKRREREREREREKKNKIQCLRFHFIFFVCVWIDRRRDLSRSIFDTKKGRHTHHPISLLRPL